MKLKQVLMNLSFGFNIIRGITVICKADISCKSHGLRPETCIIKDAYMIVNVAVFKQISERRCVYYKGSNHLEGTYGYDNNILWVDFGCQATFNVCYSVKSTAPPSEKSTMSTITTSGEESSKSTIATSVAESSIEMTSKLYDVVRSSSTSTMVYSYSYFSKETTTGTVTTEQQLREETQPKPREGPIVEIVVPVCLMSVLVVVLGIIIWKKRQLRKQNKDKQSISTDDKIKQQISDTDTNCYETPMTPEDALEKDTVTFSRNIQFSSCTTDQKCTELNSNSMPYSRKVEIPSNLHVVVDFQDLFTYSSIDENHIPVQSMPDNEYNVINTNCSIMIQDINYDTLQAIHIDDHIVGADEYSQTGKALVKMNDNREYNRVKFTNTQKDETDSYSDVCFKNVSA